MPPLTHKEREELDNLRALIGAIDRFLGWLTTDSGAVPRDLSSVFLSAYGIVRGRLGDAIGALDGIKDTEDPLWRRLDDAGLNGESLRLKLTIWQRLGGAAAPPGRAPRSRSGKLLGRVMGYVNSLLGSLATVFTGLELAKEYKDGVEAVIDEQQLNDPPSGLLNLR
jgi:hypothetical protein